MTDHKTCIQACHLCPHDEGEWFLQNDMDRYNCEQSDCFDYCVDDSVNGITLRADLHSFFDACGFGLMPLLIKSPFSEACSCDEWLAGLSPDLNITYTVSNLLATFLQLHYNHKTRPMANVRSEFIYARLAYTILQMVAGLFEPRRIFPLKAGLGQETKIVDITAK